MVSMVFSGGSVVKKLPAEQETRATSLGQEDLPEKETAPYSSILAWEILRQRSLWATLTESDTT